MDLDDQLRAQLLRLARTSIEDRLFGRVSSPDTESWPDLPRCGVFVTLRSRGQLRGCIGTFWPTEALPATIQRMAVSALHDPRFVDRPLSAGDLGNLRIELSILSQLRRLEDPMGFEIGRHGIYIRRGARVGCFLPGVAAEHGWDPATFLSRCCSEKAELDPLAWMDPATEVHVFTVDKSEG